MINAEPESHNVPKLRGHHLICLHFFNGEGFEKPFVENLVKIMKSVKKHEVEIISGGDSICCSCKYYHNNKCEYQDDQDTGILKMDSKALQLLQLKPGDKVSWKKLGQKNPDIFASWYKSFCTQCDWQWVCEKNPLFLKLRSRVK